MDATETRAKNILRVTGVTICLQTEEKCSDWNGTVRGRLAYYLPLGCVLRVWASVKRSVAFLLIADIHSKDSST